MNHGSTKVTRYTAEANHKGTIRRWKYNDLNSFFVLKADYLDRLFDWNESKLEMGHRDAIL